jgi:hypothetical protein
MMRKAIKSPFLYLALGLMVLMGCNNNHPGVFQTSGFNRATHMEHAVRQTHARKGGILRWGYDHDFDSDHRNDAYVIAKDSTVYHTKSRRLYDGLDSPSILTWFEDPSDLARTLGVLPEKN